jgi:hypothetical protein
LFDRARANRSDQVRTGQTAKRRDRELWTDAADADELLKQRLVGRSDKSEQQQRVFPHMRMNIQPHFGSLLRQRRIRRDGDRDVVADAARFDNYLVRVFLKKRAAQMGDH